METGEWNIFKDERYDPEKQICPQCKNFHYLNNGESFGICSLSNRLTSPHQLEWAVALGNIYCKGFEFKEAD